MTEYVKKIQERLSKALSDVFSISDRLPSAWIAKSYCKQFVFARLGPLLVGTDSGRRWGGQTCMSLILQTHK